MLWNKGDNELEDQVSHREITVPAGFMFLGLGLLTGYLCITVGLQSDVASTSYAYDQYLNIGLNEYSESFVTDWIRAGMIRPASDEGIVLGVLLIILSVGCFLMAGTMGPMLTKERGNQRTPDIFVIYRLLIGRVKVQDLNWPKLNIVAMGVFVILLDNVLDSLFKAKIDPNAPFIEKIAIYIAVFVVVFILNSGLSEIALTLSLRWTYSGVSLIIGIFTSLFKGDTPSRNNQPPPRQKKTRSRKPPPNNSRPRDNVTITTPPDPNMFTQVQADRAQELGMPLGDYLGQQGPGNGTAEPVTPPPARTRRQPGRPEHGRNS